MKSRWFSMRHFCLALVGSMLGLGEAHASCTTNACTDSIAMFYVDSTGLWMQLTAGLSGLTNCTPNSGTFLYLPKTDPNFAAHYAFLLSVKMTAQTIFIRTNDGTSPCTVAYSFIY